MSDSLCAASDRSISLIRAQINKRRSIQIGFHRQRASLVFYCRYRKTKQNQEKQKLNRIPRALGIGLRRDVRLQDSFSLILKLIGGNVCPIYSFYSPVFENLVISPRPLEVRKVGSLVQALGFILGSR